MSGACGPCNACCTIMGVVMTPPKPPHCKCQFETKTGCSIYDRRPMPCRDFQCLWLWTQDNAAHPMARELRPDLSGIVIEVNSAEALVIHPKHPNSWRREPTRSWLVRMAARRRVMITRPEKVLLLLGNGETRELTSIGVNAETNERCYVLVNEESK